MSNNRKIYNKILSIIKVVKREYKKIGFSDNDINEFFLYGYCACLTSLIKHCMQNKNVRTLRVDCDARRTRPELYDENMMLCTHCVIVVIEENDEEKINDQTLVFDITGKNTLKGLNEKLKQHCLSGFKDKRGFDEIEYKIDYKLFDLDNDRFKKYLKLSEISEIITRNEEEEELI